MKRTTTENAIKDYLATSLMPTRCGFGDYAGKVVSTPELLRFIKSKP